MIYAPVMIYTLNRVEHLKRCVSSLQKNGYADKTELYVSVDYPPSEKYVEGNKKVKEYLRSQIEGFADVHVYFQTENLGPHNNRMFLKKVVTEKYDRFIESEDDSEFSANFLEYIDKGLELFEGRDDIYSITAMSEVINRDDISDNIVKSVVLPIHGMGIWLKSEERLEHIDSRLFLSENVYNHKKMKMLFHSYPYLFCLLVDDILFSRNSLYENEDGTINWCDVPISIYLALSSKYCIKPILSKCRDWGLDGSGVNMKKDETNDCMDMAIDSNESFTYRYESIDDNFHLNNSIEQNYYLMNHKKKYLSAIKYVLFLFGWDWKTTEKIKEMMTGYGKKNAE